MSKMQLVSEYLEDIISPEKKALISGPFGSNIGKRFFRESGTPVIRGNNLSMAGEKFFDSGFVFVTQEKADQLNCYAEIDDLVFTAVGTIGQVGIIERGLEYQRYVISNKQLRARLNQNKIIPLFAFYWFSSKWMQRLILQRNIGSTVPLINLSVLRKLPIWYPKDLKIQALIVNLLEGLNEKIELNNRINRELEAMANLIYDYWFVQFEFPSEALAKDGIPQPYKSSGGPMVYNEQLKREIPEGWEDGSFEDIGEIVGGSTPSKRIKDNFIIESGTPWITPNDLSNNTNNKYITRGENDVTEKGIKSASLRIMPPGTILLTSRAPIGYTAISREPTTTNQGFKSIVPNKGFSTEFVFYTVRLYIKAMIQYASGSTFKEISGGTLKTLKIAIPPIDLVKSFTKRVSPIFQKQDLLERENQKLAELRDWLLPMLMNGQVTIKEAEKSIDQAQGNISMAAEGRGEYGG
jgi:type I restriction enzyme S subunit